MQRVKPVVVSSSLSDLGQGFLQLQGQKFKATNESDTKTILVEFLPAIEGRGERVRVRG